jgi:hypothetical protein
MFEAIAATVLLLGYPVAPETKSLRCWAVLEPGQTLNLDSICLEPTPHVPASPGSIGGSMTADGNCKNPDDRAADGSRCGDRAASRRKGGK